MSHWIIYFLFLYIVYKFVKNFLFPAAKLTNTMNQKMGEIQKRMAEMQAAEDANQAQRMRQDAPKEGEYIDYEEVK